MFRCYQIRSTFLPNGLSCHLQPQLDPMIWLDSYLILSKVPKMLKYYGINARWLLALIDLYIYNHI